MTRVDLRPPCPLTVQFWLLGLDARQGHLLLRGFQKRPASQGSSAYVLDTLTLHSSGLWVQRGKEVLHFNRRTHLYTLDDRLVPTRFACQLLRSTLQQHETWVMERFGPAHRQAQFSAQRPPRVVLRSLESWRQYIRPAAFGLFML